MWRFGDEGLGDLQRGGSSYLTFALHNLQPS
jgi:hypothetical protein